MVVTEWSGATAQEARRSTKSSDTEHKIEKDTCEAAWELGTSSSEFTGPPDGGTRYQGPSKRKSKGYYNKDRTMIVYSVYSP